MADAFELNPAAEARAAFARARRRAILQDLTAVIARRPNTLRSFAEARRAAAVVGERPRGVLTVPVERIVGSTDRVADYDRAFRPRRSHDAARWQSVARAYHQGKELPAVRLYQLGDAYYVVDGHHRVSVARSLGRDYIDAEVVEVRTGRPPRSNRCRAAGAGRSTRPRSRQRPSANDRRTPPERSRRARAGGTAWNPTPIPLHPLTAKRPPRRRRRAARAPVGPGWQRPPRRRPVRPPVPTRARSPRPDLAGRGGGSGGRSRSPRCG